MRNQRFPVYTVRMPVAPSSPPAPTLAANLDTGDVKVTLKWNSLNNLDLYVTDPAGETILYGYDFSAEGGILDVYADPDLLPEARTLQM